MKRPVELVKEVISESNFPFDDIFLDCIPREEEESVEKTQILLIEASNGPEEYGNSDFVSFLYGVYIQIFYSNDEDAAIDITSSEIELMKTLVEKNWLIARSQEHYLDPNTKQMIKNLTVERTMTLSEIANS